MQRLLGHTVKCPGLFFQGYCNSRTRRLSRQLSLVPQASMRVHATTAGSKLQQLYEQASTLFSQRRQPQVTSDIDALTNALSESSKRA